MAGGTVEIRLLGTGDEALVHAAADLFDDPPIAAQTAAFLASDRDLLWLALAEDRPVGFVSATVILHPDKEPHLFTNELYVQDDFRGRGIATQLMQNVVDYGRANHLWPVWVIAEGRDQQAIAFYRSLSGLSESGSVFFEWGSDDR